MRTAAPPLLPIFRSRLQGQVLASTLLHPERSQSLTELARALGADLATVQREVSRLERAGIVRTNRVGNTRLVSADTASPVHRPLAELVLQAFGPVEVVAEVFAELQDVDEIYIFGSWAARYRGIEGPAPGDIDVLVVGSPDRDQVYEAALRAERRLGREVNATIRTRRAWEAAQDGFIREVRSAPLVRVAGSKAADR
jgi:DNA-binding transcriptional regulator YhcF (GntR family)